MCLYRIRPCSSVTVLLVGVPRGTLDRFRADRLRDQQRGPRGMQLAIGMSDLLAFAADFQAHAPEGVLAA